MSIGSHAFPCMKHGPYFFAGFRMLDILGGPSTSVANVLRKVALGQITINPAYLCTLYYYLGWMEGRPHDERVSRVKEGFLPTYVSHCCFWPFVNLINFGFVPPQHRILYVGVFGGTFPDFSLLVWSPGDTRAVLLPSPGPNSAPSFSSGILRMSPVRF